MSQRYSARTGAPIGLSRYEKQDRQQRFLARAEAAGQVADSKEVRDQLIAQWQAGEIPGDEMQARLAAIKRDANKNGKLTRYQALSGMVIEDLGKRRQ